MKSTTATLLRSRLSGFLNQDEPVVVTHGGRPRAVLVPVRNPDDVERLLTAANADLTALLEAADRRISRTGGVSHDEFWARAAALPDRR